jgi:hypothetical protein
MYYTYTVGDAHRQAKIVTQTTKEKSLEQEVADRQRQVTASKRQVEVR